MCSWNDHVRTHKTVLDLMFDLDILCWKLAQGRTYLNLQLTDVFCCFRAFSILIPRHILQASVVHNASVLKFLSESYYVDNSVLCLSSRCRAIFIGKGADYELPAFPKINRLFRHSVSYLFFIVYYNYRTAGFISKARIRQNDINSRNWWKSLRFLGI